MATAKLFSKNGDSRGNYELPQSLFGHEVREHVVHEAVRAYLANQRQGNASTKERSDVSGGGGKPYRQKGTGRARAGTASSPIWRGGGVVFGPHPRNYRVKLPRRVKRIALLSALSGRANDGDVMVLDEINFPEPKTKPFVELLKSMESYSKKVLLLLDKADELVIKSARNVPGVKTVQSNMVNVYDVLWADKIVFTEKAIGKMEEVFKK